MPEMVTPGPVSNAERSIREAVCIHTSKIFDSCKEEDIAPLIRLKCLKVIVQLEVTGTGLFVLPVPDGGQYTLQQLVLSGGVGGAVRIQNSTDFFSQHGGVCTLSFLEFVLQLRRFFVQGGAL